MKTAIITGGSGGIGKIIAKALIASGFQVIVLGRDEKKLKDAEKELGKNAKSFTCDVSNYAQVEKLFNQFENIDVLVNCAGILGPTEELAKSDMSDWRAVIDTNLLGTVNCCKASIQKLEKGQGGRGAEGLRGKIINVAGGGAAYARPMHSAYATSKAAVVRFTEELAQELKNTDVNVIGPGAHNTKLQETETVDKPTKWADPADVEKLVKFLASEKSNGITGKFIHIKDNYESWNKEISKSDLYSLRRVDEKILNLASKPAGKQASK